MVEVTQEDREAAAEYVRDNQQPRLERNVRAGKAYTGLSEAFARHRIAARKLALEEVAADLRGPESWLDRWAQHVGNCGGDAVCTCGLVRARYDLATAIRALSDPHVDQG